MYNTITMSSPPAAPSSPPQDNYGPDEQLRNEAAASQGSLQPPTDGTTQNSSQVPPASSPLFFRSSPAANGGADGMSSPIRAGSTLPSDGGPTPRASGQTIGGAHLHDNHESTMILTVYLRLFSYSLRFEFQRRTSDSRQPSQPAQKRQQWSIRALTLLWSPSRCGQ